MTHFWVEFTTYRPPLTQMGSRLLVETLLPPQLLDYLYRLLGRTLNMTSSLLEDLNHAAGGV